MPAATTACRLAIALIVLMAQARPAQAISPAALQALQAACPRWDACAASAETRALREASARARREGASLFLTRADGAMRFDDVAGHQRHRYLGPLDNTGLDLVAGWRDGHTHFWLVDPASARVLQAGALPWPSPDGRLLVVAAPTLGAQGGTLDLYLHAGPRWSRLYRLEAPPGVGFEFQSWRADGAAVRLAWIRRSVAGAKATTGSDACSGTIQLRDGPYGWDLVPELPDRCP
jgi:hypothetical protein